MSNRKDKSDELRCDLIHNAPLPNSHYSNIGLSDLNNIKFVKEGGTFMKLVHYEVGDNNTLILILK